jgi:ankyrin repeat protein
MWAAREGHADVIRVLVDAGADLDLLNGDGASALSIAIVNDRFDLAADLAELGADPNDGSLFRAVEMRDAPTDWRAKDGSRLRVDYANELTALDLMRVLLDAGADPNKLFSGQNHSASMCCDTTASGTPFSRAATAADVEGLKLLVAYGADVEWTPEPSAGRGRGGGGGGGPFGGGGGARTPLQSAMDGGKGIGMAGGPGDIREGEDVPFREVANRDPADAMAVLLEAGADPNREMSSGSTLLHDAARARRLDVVEVLARHGARLDALNQDGLTALDVAEGRRAEGGGGGRRGGGPPFGGGFPGGPPGGNDDQPSDEEIAARLRELMAAAGVVVVEHGMAPGGGAD